MVEQKCDEEILISSHRHSHHRESSIIHNPTPRFIIHHEKRYFFPRCWLLSSMDWALSRVTNELLLTKKLKRELHFALSMTSGWRFAVVFEEQKISVAAVFSHRNLEWKSRWKLNKTIYGLMIIILLYVLADSEYFNSWFSNFSSLSVSFTSRNSPTGVLWQATSFLLSANEQTVSVFADVHFRMLRWVILFFSFVHSRPLYRSETWNALWNVKHECKAS